MNKQRRERLRGALTLLTEARRIVDSVWDEEQDCLDNTPDNMVDGDRYQERENAISELESASDSIESAKESIVNAM